jgi:NitT/TauT family transport system ATP-binding protein
MPVPPSTPQPDRKGASVDIRELSRNYDSVTALKDVTLSIAPGEFVALLGPSGCGKTTLLRCIAGLIAPTSGDVRVDGRDITRLPVHRRGLGMVFQSYALFPHMTVAENVGFGLRMRRIEKSDALSRVGKALALVHLDGLGGRYPTQLSGGQQQRVALARSLVTNPSVLLLDEPFGALDAQTRVIMQQILNNMWQRLKISVLFVTHDIDEAIFLSDRVYCMTARPGSIKAEVPIPLERPRQQSMMMSSEFLALKRGLMSLIREESLKAMGGEISDQGLQGLNIDLHGQSLADVL